MPDELSGLREACKVLIQERDQAESLLAVVVAENMGLKAQLAFTNVELNNIQVLLTEVLADITAENDRRQRESY